MTTQVLSIDASMAAVIDLATHRAARQATEREEQARAAEPVRFITPEFVEAMQGTWADLRPNVPRGRALRATS